jgi:hypothetical protein
MAKNPAAVSLGRAGGQARAANMSKADRSDAARKAAQARWKDRTPPTPADNEGAAKPEK